jgi:tetratricopeptide (TPR) repeat protein
VIELARASQQLTPVSASHSWHVFRYEVAGEVAPALAHGREGVDYAERAGNQTALIFGYRALGLANVLDGAWHDAFEILERALAIGRERRLLSGEGGVLALMAAAHLGLGDRARALTLAEEAIGFTWRLGARFWEFSALLTRSRALRETQGVQATRDVEAALAEADSWLEMSGAKSCEPSFASSARSWHGSAVTTPPASASFARRTVFLEIGAPIRAEQVAKELAG